MAACEFCKHSAEKICQGCKMVHYCSKTCQTLHWKEHKSNCNRVKITEKNKCESKVQKENSKTLSEIKELNQVLESTNIIEESNCKCYKIVLIPGKGKGIVAQRQIKRGELILKEKPILRIHSETLNKEQFEKLPRNQLKELFQFIYGYSFDSFDITGQMEIFREIWKKYSFDLAVYHPYNLIDSAVFKDISRINHSCIPNAGRNFIDPEMRIYAVQDINIDHEICIAYNGIKTYEQQPTIQLVKARLKAHWNFECDCELCGNTNAQICQNLEKHRLLYWKLCKDARRVEMNNDKEMLIQVCENIIKEMTYAKCWSENDRMLYSSKGLNAALDCFDLSLKDKKRKIKYFLPIFKESLLTTQGTDGPNTAEKSVFDKLKFMCKTIDSMDEKQYQLFSHLYKKGTLG